MILASHQPDFLPYPGFFYKVDKCDLFDLAVYDQYSHQGYQRRVTMGENNEWVQLVVDKDTEDRKQIIDVLYHWEKSKDRVLKAITKHYGKAPYYQKAYDLVEKAFDKQTVIDEYANLSMLNLDLIGAISKCIGIPPQKYAVGIELTKAKAEGIVQLAEYYGAKSYLSGTGTKEYITDEFEKAGIELLWSEYQPTTRNSIIELIANEPDPLKIIRGE